MDIMAMMDAMMKSAGEERSRYHLTLGKLTEAVEALPKNGTVTFDDGRGLGIEDSYRGYYDELAIGRGETPTDRNVALAMVKRAATQVYTGWKGGDFRYSGRTPLWCAQPGNTGAAIVNCRRDGDNLILELRDVD